jgi:tyrosyl-tRNA synthetase
VPEDAPCLHWNLPWCGTSLDLVAQLPEIPSRAEAKRLLQQGGVSLNGRRLALGEEVEVRPGQWMKVGKRRYFRFEQVGSGS